MSKHDTLQAEIVAWAAEAFPNSSLDAVMEHLREEVQELDTATMVSPAMGNPVYRDRVAEEAADVMHLLFQVADRYGFDLLRATRVKFIVNKARTWGEPDERGVVRHVPASEGGDA